MTAFIQQADNVEGEPGTRSTTSNNTIKNIRRATPKQHSSKEKIVDCNLIEGAGHETKHQSKFNRTRQSNRFRVADIAKADKLLNAPG